MNVKNKNQRSYEVDKTSRDGLCGLCGDGLCGLFDGIST